MSFSRKKDELNTSVEDLRDSVHDVNRSKDLLRMAKKKLDNSKKEYILRKHEVLDNVKKSNAVRNDLILKQEDCKKQINTIRNKKEDIKRKLVDRYSELENKLNLSYQKSVDILKSRSSSEISELMNYEKYLETQISNYDLLRRKVERKVKDDNGYDLDFENLQKNVRKLGKVSKIHSKPITSLISPNDFPLTRTTIVGIGNYQKIDDDDVSEISEISEIRNPRKVEKKAEFRNPRIVERKEEEDSDSDSDLSLPSSITTENSLFNDFGDDKIKKRNELGTRLNWVYSVCVEYYDLTTNEKKRKYGSAFLIWDSRLSRDFFVTSSKLFQKASKNVISTIRLTNENSDEIKLGASSIHKASDSNSLITFLEIPSRRTTLNGFSLVDIEEGYGGVNCLLMGAKYGKVTIKEAKIKATERKRISEKYISKIYRVDVITDPSFIGSPVISRKGRIIGVIIKRDAIEAVAISAKCVFDQYVKSF